MASVRPYRFTGLRRYTQQELDVEQSLKGFLSSSVFAGNFSNQICDRLSKYLKTELRLGALQISTVHKHDIAQLLPQSGCFMVLGAAPSAEKILIDLDASVASFCIDRLLGGAGDVGRIQRGLTEIEQGVLSFVILNVLDSLHDGLNTGQELALSLDRFVSKPEDMSTTIDQSESYIMLGLRVGVQKRVGYLRILLPQALVVSSFSSPPEQSGGDIDYVRARLSRMGEAQFRGRVEAATIDLSDDDLQALEPGDIVVMENHQLRLGPGGLLGEVRVRIGLGDNGMIKGELVNVGEVCRLEITSIIVQEQPAEMIMEDPDESVVAEPEDMGDAMEGDTAGGDLSMARAPQDNLENTEGLLRDVNAPVVVELGRIKLNTSQVARLREGQVLRLPRGPNDPVNLVVHGKLFARGELIEVDGELGVRLLKLSR